MYMLTEESDAWRLEVVALCQGFVGVKEATGHNDGLPSRLFMFGRTVPWCAHMVDKVYKLAGVRIPGNRYHKGNVTRLEGAFIEYLFYEEAGGRYYPRPGDVIFYKNRGASDKSTKGRHCGIVERTEGSVVHTIEGNLRNQVSRSQIDISHPRIAGFGWAG